MSQNIVLLTAAELTAEDFAAFLDSLGGVLDPGEATSGRLSNGLRHVWLFFSPETAAGATEAHGRALFDLLGQEPRSAFVAEFSRDPSGRSLAHDVAARFCLRWPPAVMDEGDALFVLSKVTENAFEAVAARGAFRVDQRPTAVAE